MILFLLLWFPLSDGAYTVPCANPAFERTCVPSLGCGECRPVEQP